MPRRAIPNAKAGISITVLYGVSIKGAIASPASNTTNGITPLSNRGFGRGRILGEITSNTALNMRSFQTIQQGESRGQQRQLDRWRESQLQELTKLRTPA